MLNAVNLAFVAFSRQTASMDGHVFAIFVMAVAAAEAAVGLALVILLFRNRVTVKLDDLDRMSG
jgi:NADH:ubiquinone oxidoreductase subunit K